MARLYNDCSLHESWKTYIHPLWKCNDWRSIHIQYHHIKKHHHKFYLKVCLQHSWLDSQCQGSITWKYSKQIQYNVKFGKINHILCNPTEGSWSFGGTLRWHSHRVKGLKTVPLDQRCTDLTGLQLGHVVSSRQSSVMSDENQQQLLTLTQILTQSHTPTT